MRIILVVVVFFFAFMQEVRAQDQVCRRACEATAPEVTVYLPYLPGEDTRCSLADQADQQVTLTCYAHYSGHGFLPDRMGRMVSHIPLREGVSGGDLEGALLEGALSEEEFLGLLSFASRDWVLEHSKSPSPRSDGLVNQEDRVFVDPRLWIFLDWEVFPLEQWEHLNMDGVYVQDRPAGGLRDASWPAGIICQCADVWLSARNIPVPGGVRFERLAPQNISVVNGNNCSGLDCVPLETD